MKKILDLTFILSIQVRIKASCVACQLLLKCRGEDPLQLFPTIVLLLSDPDEVLRRNALAAASNLVYFKGAGLILF